MLYLCQQGQMFVTGENMHAGRDQQPLSYATRLPNEAQQGALRLLDSSRSVVNAALIKLWPTLDAFRQWRCEADTAGRIMRGQAERKQVFALIQPILSHGFIRPKTEHRAAGKNRKSIKEAIEALQKTLEDDDTAFITLQNVVEQACNHFLQQGTFPETYEDMQAVPLLNVGMLTYAGDDGMAKGQSYRLSFDVQAGT